MAASNKSKIHTRRAIMFGSPLSGTCGSAAVGSVQWRYDIAYERPAASWVDVESGQDPVAHTVLYGSTVISATMPEVS